MKNKLKEGLWIENYSEDSSIINLLENTERRSVKIELLVK
jgi:hypothetical protein